MDPCSDQPERVSARRVRVRLEGVLDRDQIDQLRPKLLDAIDRLPRRGELLLDLVEVTECAIAACRALALVQRKVRASGARTAYLTARARIHGAAWWIVHASRDPHAMPVIHMDQAEQWLQGDAQRLDELHARSTRAIERARHRCAQEGVER
ncbi:MAG: hypothetical protein AAGF11_16775 [Myxococcota bacterium]